MNENNRSELTNDGRDSSSKGFSELLFSACSELSGESAGCGDVVSSLSISSSSKSKSNLNIVVEVVKDIGGVHKGSSAISPSHPIDRVVFEVRLRSGHMSFHETLVSSTTYIEFLTEMVHDKAGLHPKKQRVQYQVRIVQGRSW